MPELNKIYTGDCLEVMRTWPDKCVDLVVTDPPYGLSINYGDGIDDSKEYVSWIAKKCVPEMLRIAKNVLITCGVQNISVYPKMDWIMAWVIINGHGKCKWGFSCWQPILCYGTNSKVSKGCLPDIFVDWQGLGKAIEGHPTPKPIKIWKRLINHVVMPGQTVCDPFMGSGTTGVACDNLGVNWIGIEINPDYVKIAEARIAKERAQLRFA